MRIRWTFLVACYHITGDATACLGLAPNTSVLHGGVAVHSSTMKAVRSPTASRQVVIRNIGGLHPNLWYFEYKGLRTVRKPQMNFKEAASSNFPGIVSAL